MFQLFDHKLFVSQSLVLRPCSLTVFFLACVCFSCVLQLPAEKERRYMVDRTARYVAKDGQPFEQVSVLYLCW